MLVKGCPYTGDNYQTQLIPVQKVLDPPFPSYYQCFSILPSLCRLGDKVGTQGTGTVLSSVPQQVSEPTHSELFPHPTIPQPGLPLILAIGTLRFCLIASFIDTNGMSGLCLKASSPLVLL